MIEIWKPVDGYEERYEVSSLGRVRNLQPNSTHSTRQGSREWNKGVRNVGKTRVLRGVNSNAGYLRVGLWCPKKHRLPRSFTVHGLVATAFLGTRPDGCEVNHRNGNKLDNRAENLEYVTKAENLKHARVVLRKEWTRHGETHNFAKLTGAQVAEIRLATGTHAAIAQRYSVAQSTVSRIKANKRRKHG